MTEILIGLALGLSVTGIIVGLLAYQRARDLSRDRWGDDSFPYRLRNGVEDATAISIDMLIKSKRHIEWVELRARELNKLLGEIRNGEYDKDQPHKRRN